MEEVVTINCIDLPFADTLDAPIKLNSSMGGATTVSNRHDPLATLKVKTDNLLPLVSRASV